MTLELTTEIIAVGKPHAVGDIADRKFRIHQKKQTLFQTQHQKILVRRISSRLPELTGQCTDRHSRKFRHPFPAPLLLRPIRNFIDQPIQFKRSLLGMIPSGAIQTRKFHRQQNQPCGHRRCKILFPFILLLLNLRQNLQNSRHSSAVRRNPRLRLENPGSSRNRLRRTGYRQSANNGLFTSCRSNSRLHSARSCRFSYP